MKVIVIGVICIIWLQNSCVAPKWTGAAEGDTYDDDLDFQMDNDFSDTELDLIYTEHNDDGLTLYNDIPYQYDDKGRQGMQSMKCKAEPPSLLGIGFTVLRLVMALWFLSLLGSLGVRKDVVSVGTKDDHPEQLNEGTVPKATADDMYYQDVKAVLEDLLQGVLNAIQNEELEPAIDPTDKDSEQHSDNEYTIEVQLMADDPVLNELTDPAGDIQLVEQVTAVLDDLIQNVVNKVSEAEEDCNTDPENNTAQAPHNENAEEVPILSNDEVPTHAEDAIRDIDKEVRAVLEDLLQGVMKAVDMEEKEHHGSSKSSENGDLLLNTADRIMTPPSQNPELLESDMDGSESSSWKASSDSISSLLSMDTIRQQFLNKPNEIEGSGLTGSGGSSRETVEPSKYEEASSPGIKEKSSNIFRRAFRAIRRRKISSEKKEEEVPTTEEQPPKSQGSTVILSEKEWLVQKNKMWRQEPNRPFGHRAKVSFRDEVEVKTFLVRKPMHLYVPDEGLPEITQVEPLKKEGQFHEVGLFLTRKCFRHRLSRGIMKLDEAFQKKSTP